MSKKLKYENKEKYLITNTEISGIVIVFSFILYIIFPGEKILNYALNEKYNAELSELYLKSIYEKYPQKTNILFALVELYLKNDKIDEARRILSKAYFKDEAINFKIELLKTKLKIKTLDKNEELINEIYNFFIKNKEKLSLADIALIFHFNQKLIDLKNKKKPCNLIIELFHNHADKTFKKNIALEYISFLKRNELILDCYSNVKHFEDFALENDDLSYEIIKLYLEAGKPSLASEFSYKVMKNKGIL